MHPHSKYNRAARKRNAKIVQEHKKNKACVDCGGLYPYYVLDLDHLDPKTKIAKVSYLASQSVSKKRLLAEIAKTEIRCSNCHRIKTHQRRKLK